jgi:hypothetical protein
MESETVKTIDGHPVANATSHLRVTVEPEDIRKGMPLNPNACAIARACVRQLPRVVAAKVHFGRLYLKYEGQTRWRKWGMPEYAVREQIAFDRGGRFVPQEIIFNPLPVETVIASATRKRRRVASASAPRGPKRKRHVMTDVRPSAYADEKNEKGS